MWQAGHSRQTIPDSKEKKNSIAMGLWREAVRPGWQSPGSKCG